MDFIPYVGLLRDSSICQSEKPEGIINDTQGITLSYISDVKEIPIAAKKIGWEKLNEARLLAAEALQSDLAAMLGGAFPTRQMYSGKMGNTVSTDFVLPENGIARLPIPTTYMEGGSVIIRTLGLKLSSAVTDQVISLYKEDDVAPFKTVTVPLIREKSKEMKVLAPAWFIPTDGSHYELRAILPTGVMVGKNTIKCGCSGNVGSLETVFQNCCKGSASGFMMLLGSHCEYDALYRQLLQLARTRNVLTLMLSLKAGAILTAPKDSSTINRKTTVSESDSTFAYNYCNIQYDNRLAWLKSKLSEFDLLDTGACFSKARPGGWKRTSGSGGFES